MLKVFATCAAVAACLAVFTMTPSASAGEVPQAVKDACRGDYKKHCSMHKPESVDARDCMADAFRKLSDGCVSAILDSDLVDQHTKTAEKPAPAAKSATRVADSGKATRKSAKVRKAKRRVARTSRKHKARVARAEQRHSRRQRVAARRHRSNGSGKVARYINRGSRIANFYVSKYTTMAFNKAFR